MDDSDTLLLALCYVSWCVSGRRALL